MRSCDVYLTFDGNCREAMEFYAAALDAPLQLMDASGMPGAAEQDRSRVMHARIEKGTLRLMASDTMSMTPYTLQPGNNFSISLDCENEAEQDRAFDMLKQGGEVRMELQDTFWNARFGMLVDRFGIQWMFNLDRQPH